MCGIIGFISKDNKSKNAGKEIINQYQEQLNRGQKGFGVVQIFKDRIEIERAVEPIKALMDTRLSTAPVMIFHHRFPTSTENTMNQTHPFIISHDELEFDYCIVHNGVISNSRELLKEHGGDLGYIYSTLEKPIKNYNDISYLDKFNDSEALAIEVARYFNGDTAEIKATGTIVFMAIQLDKKTKKPLTMLWGRNSGNPLDCLESDEGLLLASVINKEGAEIIQHDSFETFDLQKYFTSKAKTQDVYHAVESGTLDFYVKPVIKLPTAKKVGFHANTETNTKSTKTGTTYPYSKEAYQDLMEDIDSGYGDNQNYYTPREEAFEKMAERTINELKDKVYTFFQDLAFSEVDENEAQGIINSLEDSLLEKADTAREKVRPYFDHEEDMELDRIMENDIRPNTKETEQPTLENERIEDSENAKIVKGVLQTA